MNKISEFIKEWGSRIIFLALIVVASIISSIYTYTKPNQSLKEYKDGIQNHLVFSIKGECYFVRPHTDETVYLIRVPDCDRK
jgi:uncharacterized membrane protein